MLRNLPAPNTTSNVITEDYFFPTRSCSDKNHAIDCTR